MKNSLPSSKPNPKLKPEIRKYDFSVIIDMNVAKKFQNDTNINLECQLQF